MIDWLPPRDAGKTTDDLPKSTDLERKVATRG